MLVARFRWQNGTDRAGRTRRRRVFRCARDAVRRECARLSTAHVFPRQRVSLPSSELSWTFITDKRSANGIGDPEELKD